jgi:hypothetical protein
LAKVTYSVYNVKDDMPIIIAGTIEECAKALGIEVCSFKSAASRQRHGRRWNGSKRSCIIIRDEPEEEDDGD